VNRSPRGAICVITSVHPPFDTRIFHKEAKTLGCAGYDVTLIARYTRDETIDGIRIVALPIPRNRFVRVFGLTWRTFRLALRQRADVYHVHDPELLPIGALLKLITRRKVIYDIHENVPAQIRTKSWIPHSLRPAASLIYRLSERLLLRFVDVVVLAEDSYLPQYSHCEQVSVVHNYPLLRSPREKATPNTFRAVYVGGVTEQRGASTMLKAAASLNGRGISVHWTVAGPIRPRDLEAKLREAAVGIPRLDILGPVPYEEAQKLISSAHVGLAVLKPIPNYIESLPTKLLEYMMAGIPVIASDFPLWREIVEGSQCGLVVDPLDSGAIADAIESLMRHPEKAGEMGRNGRQAVEEKYNWRQEAARLLALYDVLLGGQGSKRLEAKACAATELHHRSG